MAEAITYADLRFVKAPVKKSLSVRLGPEAEAYENGDADGELTYENVQVPVVPGGAGLASSGLGDKAGKGSPGVCVCGVSWAGEIGKEGGFWEREEQEQIKGSQGKKTDPGKVETPVGTPPFREGQLGAHDCVPELRDVAGCRADSPLWVLPLPARPGASMRGAGPATCLQHLLLGLLLTCLLLGVATICLGVRYLQVSQQLQHTKRVLEATNSSLWQQLRQKIAQLGQKEGDLKESREELARSQEVLQEEQRVHQTAKEQLHTCQVDREKIKETLQGEEKQREALERRLSTTKDTLKRFFTCPSEVLCQCCNHSYTTP
ncbi:B-cell differentiation antigen CD72 [Erethizon dorsatum]